MGLFAKQYRTPAGQCPNLYLDMIKRPHMLIAGATGSGKSVAVNGMIYAAIYGSPARAQLVLIDPKRVELYRYRKLPHVIAYAADPDPIIDALRRTVTIIDDRYKRMQRAGELTYDGPDIYVIIDELADLMTTDKKRAAPLIQRIGQIGRAARVHLIACTQCPLASVIPTAIKVNLDARLGLRTRSAQDSRNVIGQTGLETLPQYGEGVYMVPQGMQHLKVPMVPTNEIDRLISWWTGPKCRA